MHNRRTRRRTNRRTNRRTSGGEIGAPYPGSLYAEQNQPSYGVLKWSVDQTAQRPSPAEMRNVAHGGSRRKHRRRKHGKRHTRR